MIQTEKEADNYPSFIQNVILSQGRFALSAVLEKISELYECLKFAPQFIGFYPHPRIPQILSEICINQGLASSILFNNSKRGKKEDITAYNFRLERFKYIKSICEANSISTPILLDRKMRNQLIHIDEYLFENLRKPNIGWFIDIAFDYRDQFQAPNGMDTGFCRSFIASEEAILHFDNEISVPKLWHEVTSVLSAVFEIPTTERPLLLQPSSV